MFISPVTDMTSSTHLITTAEQSFQFRQLRQTSASRLTVMRLLTLTALRRLSTPSAVLIWKLLRTKLTTSTIRCTRTIRLTQEQLSQTHPVLFISTVRRLFGMLETEALQRARTATKSVLTVTTGTEPQDRENFLKLCSQV